MGNQSNPTTLSEETFRQGVADLCERDPGLAGIVLKWGNPPFWTHMQSFPGIVSAILAQQVSLESAKAAFGKLEKAMGSIGPESFLSLEDDTLRAIGFSRQKASYVRGIANEIVAGTLDFAKLNLLSSNAARKRLMGLRGIGAWTADAYLLFSLRRSDVWPSGDLALEKAIQDLRGLASKPSSEQADRTADDWRPLRAVAARILWHHYLCERGRRSSA